MGKSSRIALVTSAAALATLGACFSSNNSGPPGDGLDGGDATQTGDDGGTANDGPSSLPDATLGDAMGDGSTAVSDGSSPTSEGSTDGGQASDAPASVTEGGEAGPVYVATQIAMSDEANCAILADGTVRCWGGARVAGVPPDSGAATYYATPVAVPGLTGITQIAGWGNYFCALSSAGSVYCWGETLSGHVPVAPPDAGSTPYAYAPTQVSLPAQANMIRVNIDDACARLVTGEVDCWGYNPSARLGIVPVPTATYLTPTAMTGVAQPADIQMGANSTCLLYDSGTANCVGYGGPATLGSPSAPSQVAGFDASVPVALSGAAASLPPAAGTNMCAILTSGNVQCWGAADYSSDAAVTLGSVSTPQTVPGIANVKALSAGFYHACAIDGAGDVYCWGYNYTGATGDLDSGDFYSTEYPPIRVPGLPAVAIGIAVSTDLEFSNVSTSCALLQGGAVWCWGSNNYDVLGRGGTGTAMGAYPPGPVAF
jgi:hypothetical protein